MRSIIAIVLFMLSGSAYAEVDVVSIDPEHKFSGNVAFGGFQTQGNSETKTLDGKIELTHAYNQWSTGLVLVGTQTSESNQLTLEYYEAELKPEYNFANQTYAFVLLGYKEDIFGGVIWETTQLAGIGYHAFTDEPTYAVDLEIGYGARDSKKENRTNQDHDPGTHLAILSEYKLSEENAFKINLRAELGNDDDFIKKEVSWEHHLFGQMSINFDYEVRTDSKPALGKERSDSKTSVKLGYEF
ncbi:MAG: DUF481 domain-containing protein [Ghiorsea sp.]